MHDGRLVIVLGASEPAARASTLERARRRGFTRFGVRSHEPSASVDPDVRWELTPERVSGPGAPGGVVIETIRTPEDLLRAHSSSVGRPVLAIRWELDRLIPLENAIARRPDGTEIWVITERIGDVPGALGALESGADRVFVSISDPSEVDRLEAMLDPPVPERLPWELAVVRRVEPVGLGDRVLVDTTSMLGESEGMLIGSQAGFLFHVRSEAVGSSFSRPRPFRVNAGATHSYILAPGGATFYLSELEGGQSLLAVSPPHTGRTVRIGRLKVERRPMVMVEAEAGSGRFTIFLQEAETVRLSGESGPMATTAIGAGARVYGVRLPAARHLGGVIEETISER